VRALAICKDLAGLLGSGLVAWPFFNQAALVRLRQRLQAPVRDPGVEQMRRKPVDFLRETAAEPGQTDLWRMRVGLALIALSFLMSIGLTLAQ
jgi:hypothetical protein